MSILYPVPVLVYATLSLLFLIVPNKAGAVKCLLVSSYCGLIVTTFTGGSSGAILLPPLFLFLVGLGVIWRRPDYAFDSTQVTKSTKAMLIIFFVGIIVGMLRYDPSVEVVRAGTYKTILGLPIRFLMAGYRMHVVAFLFLAFSLPLRYYIDRRIFLQCLALCWVFSVAHAASGIIHYFGIYDLAFSYRALAGFTKATLLGWHGGSSGNLLVTGIFMTFAMTQLTRSHLLKILGYASAPVLIVALLFSLSRSSVIFLIIASLSLVLTLGGFARAIQMVLVAAFGALVAYMVMMRVPEMQERFGFVFTGDIGPEASMSRILLWKDLIRWLLQSPGVILAGVGFQNFHYFANLYAEAVGFDNAHNNFLHLLTEIGIIGLGVFLIWLASIFRWLISWRRTMVHKIDRTIPAIFMSLMLGLVAACMFGNSLAPSLAGITYQIHLYLLLGIWISYYRTQMLESYVDLESFDGEQYVYDEYDFADEVSCDADQYSYNY